MYGSAHESLLRKRKSQGSDYSRNDIINIAEHHHGSRSRYGDRYVQELGLLDWLVLLV